MDVVGVGDLFAFCAAVKDQFDFDGETGELVDLVKHRVFLLVAMLQDHQRILYSASTHTGEQINLSSDSAYVMHVRHAWNELQSASTVCSQFLAAKNKMLSRLKQFLCAKQNRDNFQKLLNKFERLQKEIHDFFSTELAGLQLAWKPSFSHYTIDPYNQDVAAVLAATQKGIREELLDVKHGQELQTLLSMPADEQSEVVQALFEGDADAAQKVEQVLEAVGKTPMTVRMPEHELVNYARGRLKDAINHLEDALPQDRVLTDLNNCIGSGGSSCVYAGLLREGSTPRTLVAVKVLMASPGDLSHYGREVAVLRKLSNLGHRHVVQFYGWMTVRLRSGEDRVALVMERCKAPVSSAIYDEQFDLLQDRVPIVGQIASGMAFLSRNGLVNRDLKPDNVLLRYGPSVREYGNVVLADYGLATTLASIRSMVTADRTTAALQGTSPYMAPELRADSAGPSEQTDVFAFGLTAAFVLCRAPAFDLKQSHIAADDASLRQYYDGLVGRASVDVESRGVLEMLCMCCHVDPQRRPRFSSLEGALRKLVLSTYVSDHRPQPAQTATLDAISPKISEHNTPARWSAHLSVDGFRRLFANAGVDREEHMHEYLEAMSAAGVYNPRLLSKRVASTQEDADDALQALGIRRLVHIDRLVELLAIEADARLVSPPPDFSGSWAQLLRSLDIEPVDSLARKLHELTGGGASVSVQISDKALSRLCQGVEEVFGPASQLGELLCEELRGARSTLVAKSQNGASAPLAEQEDRGNVETELAALRQQLSASTDAVAVLAERLAASEATLVARDLEIANLRAQQAAQQYKRAAIPQDFKGLHEAAREGQHDRVRKILDEVHIDVDVLEMDLSGTTSLHKAAAAGNLEVVMLLLERGSKVAEQDKSGRTSLHWAAEKGHFGVATLLLNHGAPIGVTDSAARTSLHWAASEGWVEVVRLLLDNREPIEATDKDGSTSLLLASKRGKVAAARLLLDRGANIAAVDKDGRTSLHWASVGNDAKMVSLLLEKGAQIGAKDKSGKTCRDLAQSQGKSAMVKLLEGR